MLTLSNVPILWCLLVGLKTFHELGHAYACKRFGGTVPEMGAMIMMGTPCAYVDASSSWGFPNRWHRMIVALAGMYFESMLAMVAILVWLATDTGQLHSAAQYAIVLSTVVTIGFNANPLMRYDGYFILSDLVNIPNLHRDAKAAGSGFIKWILYGVPQKAVASRRSVNMAMTAFGIACMLDQVTVSLGIATLLTLSVPIVGPVIALFVSGLPGEPRVGGTKIRAAIINSAAQHPIKVEAWNRFTDLGANLFAIGECAKKTIAFGIADRTFETFGGYFGRVHSATGKPKKREIRPSRRTTRNRLPWPVDSSRHADS